MMNHQELIEIASKDEWTLECDKKMLDMMQNIASKIENRATNTKSKMNTMILNLDETKVKMSNLTRISDVKNSVFCENLITDDHLEPINEVPKTDALKLLSTQIAIENGLKLMENCFEKHRVNFNPSESRSETNLVYRPVDKFYSSLPYLIGSDKWKEKWHLGLIEEDKVSQTGSTYAESSGSNATQNIESNLATGSSLMASTDSLAKSLSSIGDQMVINKPTGLFDEVYDEPKEATTPQPTISSFFRPQPAERKIVNLFDDEPPELDDSSYNRKPVNLFEDDYQSVASLPMHEDKVDNSQFQPPPPVDLFNENEFDDFIKRMENRNQQPSEIDNVKEKVSAVSSGGVQRDMKIIADEIKKVQLKKRSEDSVVSKIEEKVEQPKVIKPKVQEPIVKNQSEPKEIKNSIIQPVMPVTQQKTVSFPTSQKQEQPVYKSKPKIANLFDDDDDEDFFDEIMKQKSTNSAQSKPAQSETLATKIIPEKKKITNLFDDEDEEDAFEDIFNKKSANFSTPKKNEKKQNIELPKPVERKEIAQKLFNDDDDEKSFLDDRKSSLLTNEKNSKTLSNSLAKEKVSNLFEDSQKSIFEDQKPKQNSSKLFDDSVSEAKETKSIFQDHKSKIVSNLFEEETKTIFENPNKSSNLFDEAENLKTSSENRKQSLISDNKFTTEDSLKISHINEKGQQPQTPPPTIDKHTSQLVKGADNMKRKINLFDDAKDDEDFFVNKGNKIDTSTSKANKIENESSKIEIKSEKTSNIEIPKSEEKTNNEIMSVTEKTHDKVPKTDIENTTEQKSAPFDDFNRSIPFLNDVPPDDEDTWDTEENNNFEEPESKSLRENFNQSKSSYQMPLFDDVPPDDEDFSESNAPPISSFDEFDDEDENTLRENEDLPSETIEYKEEIDTFKESIRQTIENNDFNDQWSDFKDKIKRKTEIETQEVDKELDVKKNEENLQGIVSLSSSLRESYNTSVKSDKFNIVKSDSAETTSNIKNKLDLFTKSQEQPNVSQSEPKKLPGKLNSSLKINVSALMPGARLPKKEESPPKIINMDKDEKDDSMSTSSTSIKNENNTNLLNNEATKLRAKIQVKRRPSTRKGRRSIYEKTLNEHLDENEEEKRVDNKTINELAPPSVAKYIEPNSSNLSINDNDKSHNKSKVYEELNNAKASMSNIFDEEPPPLESSNVPNIIRNKIPVFYDDEDETKKMLEEQKRKHEANENEKNAAATLFDDVEDDIFGGSSNIVQEAKPQLKVDTNLLFGDEESDEEIFKPKSIVKEIKHPKKDIKKKIQKSLFDDDEDDDDLFGKSQNQKKEAEQKSEQLFDSQDKQQGSIIFAKSKNSKKQSLFGESDEDDDDDLFSSKPKNIPSKSSNAMKSSTSTVKKTSSAVNDPLKDLLDK